MFRTLLIVGTSFKLFVCFWLTNLASFTLHNPDKVTDEGYDIRIFQTPNRRHTQGQY